jgi:hypothetical protein
MQAVARMKEEAPVEPRLLAEDVTAEKLVATSGLRCPFTGLECQELLGVHERGRDHLHDRTLLALRTALR